MSDSQTVADIMLSLRAFARFPRLMLAYYRNAKREGAKEATARIAELEAEVERLREEASELTRRAVVAEAKLAQVVSVGHDDDCIFCGFKDRIASGEDAALAAVKEKS
jgi:hypothetical protein